MPRGTIFHACLDSAYADRMDESDFYDHTDILKADYVQNLPMNQADCQLEILKRALEESGFHVLDGSQTPDGGQDVAFILDTFNCVLQDCKNRWFQPRLSELKERMAGLSLPDFASNGPAVPDLQHLIEDDYGDMVHVHLDNGMASTLNMDSFIRSLEPNRLYYFSRAAVLMH